MAPEIYTSRTAPCNAKMTDVFSLGVLFFILAFGAPPFHSAQMSDSYFKFLRARPQSLDFFKGHPHTKALYKQGYLSESLMRLLLSLLAPEPSQRMTNLEDLFSFEFMQPSGNEGSLEAQGAQLLKRCQEVKK
mmetsp:Transcript_14140/g.22042  ORF Transcript_14140/g.22042 Transcript_14140/m.22042 type:complete len:133 (-) Transcript_14140:90-488(-)